jgi:hypothetical protein
LDQQLHPAGEHFCDQRFAFGIDLVSSAKVHLQRRAIPLGFLPLPFQFANGGPLQRPDYPESY